MSDYFHEQMINKMLEPKERNIPCKECFIFKIEEERVKQFIANYKAIPLDNVVKLPKDEVVYGYISKQFPTTNVFFDSYETALNSAIHDQPKNRPFYMIKATRHFEFCGIVKKDEAKHD